MRIALCGFGVALVALAGCATLDGGAPAVKTGFFSISGRGEGGWTLTCVLQKDGRTSNARVRGQSDERTYISEGRVSGATCQFKAADDGAFDLLVNTADFACPFPAATDATCERRVAAGESGEVAIVLR